MNHLRGKERVGATYQVTIAEEETLRSVIVERSGLDTDRSVDLAVFC
jgi:hypothetical protein